jgi:squalene-associated FAD-dependent desaturase
MTSPRVAVIGAGLAGLSAGVALRQAGAHVEVFERKRILGGKATSFTVDGVEVDNGQHVVLGCCTAFLDFIDSLGMRSALHMQPRFEVRVLARGARPARLAASWLPAPLHLAASFARYPHLRTRDKFRVAQALLAARKQQRSGGDMATWLARRGQTVAARRAFWDPFLVPALNAPLEQVAAADGLFVINTAFSSSRGAARIGYATVPLARVAETAARQLDAVHKRSPVIGLERDGAHVMALRTESERRDDFDAFVVAIPPERLAALLGDATAYGLNGLESFRNQPIVDVHLWYDVAENSAPLLGDAGFAALLDSPVQWVFEKGRGYLCCSMSAAGDAVTRPESELVARCDAELRDVIPSLRASRRVRGAATRDPDATFVPTPGLVRPGPRTACDNLVIAGAWTDTGWPATMESAVRSGRAAAHDVLRVSKTVRETRTTRPVEEPVGAV